MKRSDGEWKCDIYVYYVGSEENKHFHFGPTMSSGEEVADRVRRAQQACLNPSRNPEDFLHGIEFDEGMEQSFTNNYVSIQISGPGLVDLSFVDLPGMCMLQSLCLIASNGPSRL